MSKFRDVYNYIKNLVATGVVPETSFNQRKNKVFGFLDNVHPAYTFNYRITIYKNPYTPEPIELVGCTDFNNPTAGVNFRNAPENGYRVTAQLEEIDNITFSYWDTVDWQTTQNLQQYVYNTQFSDNGMLVEDYANAQCTVEFGPWTRVYNGCAISKPIPKSGSANNGLLMFSFNLAFNYKTETYNKTLL